MLLFKIKIFSKKRRKKIYKLKSLSKKNLGLQKKLIKRLLILGNLYKIFIYKKKKRIKIILNKNSFI
jgi:hypothetical protein